MNNTSAFLHTFDTFFALCTRKHAYLLFKHAMFFSVLWFFVLIHCFWWCADILVNFWPAFLQKRINVGKVGWLVFLQKKKVVGSYVGSARNGFRKFLLFAFLHGRRLSCFCSCIANHLRDWNWWTIDKKCPWRRQAPFLFDFDCSYASCLEILICFPLLISCRLLWVLKPLVHLTLSGTPS